MAAAIRLHNRSAADRLLLTYNSNSTAPTEAWLGLYYCSTDFTQIEHHIQYLHKMVGYVISERLHKVQFTEIVDGQFNGRNNSRSLCGRSNTLDTIYTYY